MPNFLECWTSFVMEEILRQKVRSEVRDLTIVEIFRLLLSGEIDKSCWLFCSQEDLTKYLK